MWTIFRGGHTTRSAVGAVERPPASPADRALVGIIGFVVAASLSALFFSTDVRSQRSEIGDLVGLLLNVVLGTLAAYMLVRNPRWFRRESIIAISLGAGAVFIIAAFIFGG
jgi:hypothetical protein